MTIPLYDPNYPPLEVFQVDSSEDTSSEENETEYIYSHFVKKGLKIRDKLARRNSDSKIANNYHFEMSKNFYLEVHELSIAITKKSEDK